MPMRARSFGRSVLGSFTEIPATVTVPSWNGSSPLTHLISVDLPEPDGPHTTTTSPLATSIEQSFSTWKSWYHLLTLLIVIMDVSTDDRGPALQPAHELRGQERDDEINQRREQVHLDQAPVTLRYLRGRAHEIGDRNHVNERCILEQDDGLGE